MKVLYYGKHLQPNNDDEGAIFKALKYHGCHVDRFYDSYVEKESTLTDASSYDFALFHRSSADVIKASKVKKKVVWFFDALNKGFDNNDEHIASILPYFDFGFFTDGDYVDQAKDSRISFLMQGYDDLHYNAVHDHISIRPEKMDVFNDNNELACTFIGTCMYMNQNHQNAYTERLELINYISNVANIHTKYNIFKEGLTNVCRSSAAMICMPPVTDKYASNRVFLLGGRGAVLIHPESKLIRNIFGDILYYYKTKEELKNIVIDLNAKDNDINRRILTANIVLDNHCYRHRVKELLERIK